MDNINDLRIEIDRINKQLLTLLNRRADLTLKIGKEKQKHGYTVHDPIREQHILETLMKENKGPFKNEDITGIFKEIFQASKKLQKTDQSDELLISRKKKQSDTIIKIKNQSIGGSEKALIFGPCSIESYEQMEQVAKKLNSLGIKFIRGGAFKPRTSPYSFQGLGIEGLKIMGEICNKHDLISFVEVMDQEQLDIACDYVDIVQIGARNMQNFSLLKKVGKINKPVFLKRGLSATIEEFKMSAEYIIANGNPNIILCERGIRTYEQATRNTLDLSAVPILKNETHLPVIVDISHSAGRKDIMDSLARASLAAGADGIMAEIHPNPLIALSDAGQQLDFEEFMTLYKHIQHY
ncbi:bifunctional 3-deoxy-7-phosphoheptulonate synthase/chorismate mutase [Haloplasma contractile]|uniref:Protein AroA n=1 Tax=Haloplasma contractile SSD-17B TaxID=1033810 RepID=U2FLK7_9MOLU|nr:bifunctional 3-deoxy-7-phosphoheptulonate synthase/chorismate mutase [Haloplasma contractile]ERJ13630.1 Protein AroA [Haloplasma contractile SSD-17B]